jgi:hypothetical protein
MVLDTKIIYSYVLNYAASPEELTQCEMRWGGTEKNKDLEGCDCVIFERTISSYAWENLAKYEI